MRSRRTLFVSSLLGTSLLALGTTGCHPQAAQTGSDIPTDQPSPAASSAASTPTVTKVIGQAAHAIFASDSGRGSRGISVSTSTGPLTLSELAPAGELPSSEPVKGTGKGLIVCDPVPAAGTDDTTVAFASGCGEWLNYIIGELPDQGQKPLLTSIARAQRELNHTSDLRLSQEDALQIARATGATHIAVGTLTGSGAQAAISYTIYDAASGKPVGDPVTASGGTAKIRAALPAMATQMAQRLGTASPHLSAQVDAYENELAALGRSVWTAKQAPEDFNTLQSAASHCALADICFLAERRFESRTEFAQKTALLLTKLSPKNPQAWAEVAFLQADAISPYLSQLDALRQANPHNYALAHTDVWRNRVSGTPKAERRAAEDAVRNAPQNPDAWLTLAWTLSNEAERLRRSRTADQMSPEEWSFLNAIYPLWEGAAQKATECDPQHEIAWMRLATSATFAGDYSVADTAFKKAEQYDPDKNDVYSWGLQMYQQKWGGSKADLDLVAERASQAEYSDAQSAGGIAAELRGLGYEDRARELTDRYLAKADAAVAANPNSVSAHWERASALYHADRKAAACKEYAKVVAMDPANVRAQYDYATALDEMGADDKCIPVYRTVMQLDPNNANAPIRLGAALKRKQQYAEAEKWLQMGVQRQPDSEDGHFYLGEIYLWGPNERAAAAAEEFKRTMELDGLAPIVYANRTYALTDAGNAKEAIHWGEEGVNRLAEHTGNDALFLHGALAYAYLHAKKFPEAVSEAKLSTDGMQNDLNANETLGDAYNELGQRADARKSWQVVVQKGTTRDPAGVKHAKEMLAKYPENGK